MVELRVEVLGPVRVLRDGGEVDLGGPRQRELLARLAAARGRPVSFERLAADLWDDDADRDPRDRRGALATSAGDLRRRLEPERASRARPRVLVTEHGGYALRLPDDALDAARLEAAVARATAPAEAGDAPSGTMRALADAVAVWRGEPYGDLPDREWVRTERRHLVELHARAVELLAEALLADGRPGEAVAALDPHAAAHPWRERAWALLALALYREGRQADALDVVRRARRRLADELGLEPGPELARLERDVLGQAPSLDGPTPGPRLAVTAPTSRTHLRSTVDVARTLAIAGGDHLATAQQQRVAAALAAEATGDPVLTARTVTAYDVPAVWTRSDDPEAADALVDVARRTLGRLGADAAPVLRARLLAVVGIEHRGTRDAWAWAAAEDAVGIARDVGDPGTLALALNARFLQSFQRPGAGVERDRTGAELVALAEAHDLPTFAILGHLVRMQAAAGTGRFAVADAHAAAAEDVAAGYESPVVPMLTAWYRAMRDAETAPPDAAAHAYRAADDLLAGVRMPGVRDGLLPLALLTVRLRHGRPLGGLGDPGPYTPWVEPLRALDAGDRGGAAQLARAAPEPPADHLRELRWALVAETAVRLGDAALARRARHALARVPDELAGGGSGLVSAGPVRAWLDRLDGRRTSAGPPGDG